MSDRALLLSRSDVARFLPLRALASSIGDAYIRHSTDGGAVPRPQRARAQIEDGASVVVNFPGVLAGYDAYTVKVNAKTEANRDVGYVLRSYCGGHPDGTLEPFQYLGAGRRFAPGIDTAAWMFKRSVCITGVTFRILHADCGAAPSVFEFSINNTPIGSVASTASCECGSEAQEVTPPSFICWILFPISSSLIGSA